MFKDYYRILEVDFNATQEEIKSAFRKQALKWHPDKNPNMDTTNEMQEIAEAYLILKDEDARLRYNQEYKKYYKVKTETVPPEIPKEDHQKSEKYTVEDDILRKWMENAQRQSVSMAKEIIAEMRTLVKVGGKAAGKEMANYFIGYLIFGIISLFVFLLAKGCE